MKKTKILITLCSGLLLFGCEDLDQSVDLTDQALENEIVYMDLGLQAVEVKSLNENARMLPQEYKAKLYKAEYLTAPGSRQMGRTIIFNDKGSKKLDVDFSPFAKLNKTPDISFYVDEARPSSSIGVATSTAAIDRAAQTWEDINCSNLGMYKIAAKPQQIGIIADFFGYTSFPAPYADVENLGFMPAEFFDFLAPGGSDFILAVTFTFTWVDEFGNPIDTNRDRKWDTAFAEIYYNDNFPWDNPDYLDLETVALHEMGHGLSQAHFGTGFIKKNGKVQFSPRAVMNATYSGIQTQIRKTDLGGHCSIWANWPNK